MKRKDLTKSNNGGLKMKAVVMRAYGSADVLEIQEVDKPVASSNQVLIQVFYASVNPVDWKIRNGSMRMIVRPKFPLTPGLDIAGEIVETGSNSTKFKKNDKVFGMLELNKCGAYAEYACAKEENVAMIPENIDFKEAAATPLAALTAYQALHHKGKIKSGENILINGSSGGVGSFAIQIAKAAGATVTAVCSTGNIELVKSLGADKVIDYKKQDFTQLSDQYNIIFDTVGKPSFFKVSKNLTKSGRYITTVPNYLPNMISFFLIPFLSLLIDRKKSAFITVRPGGTDLKSLCLLIQQDKLVPLIDRTYNLEDIRKAHSYSEAGHARGKIVIKIS